ncbi:MAG: hypothetical protein LBL83_11570 [Clostridiales bacterium]|nr:hypothetical protein [Clostridiales bacterium]
MKYKAEAFDIWQNLCKTVLGYEPLIRCRIDFAGRVDLRALKQAVDLSIHVIPLIGCCFSDSRNRPRWVEKNFTSEDMIRVIEADSSAGDNAERQIARLLSSDFDAAKEPPLNILLIRRAYGDTLCVIISHMVCDGGGFKQYLYLLGNLYTALESGRPVSIQPFNPQVCTRGLQPLFKGVKLKEKARILCSKNNAYGSANKKGQQGVSFGKDGSEPHMKTRGISNGHFERLKSFAKMHGATVNDILMALYARAFCKNTGTEKIMLPSTMDLRKFMPPGANFGISNYASTCMCHISVQATDSLADTLRQVSGQMWAHKTGNAILKPTLFWDMLTHFLPYSLVKLYFANVVTVPAILYSNLGILDQNLLRFGNLLIENAYSTSSIKPAPYLQINASTYNGCCTLCCDFYGSDIDEKWVNVLLDDICAEIESLARAA